MNKIFLVLIVFSLLTGCSSAKDPCEGSTDHDYCVEKFNDMNPEGEIYRGY